MARGGGAVLLRGTKAPRGAAGPTARRCINYRNSTSGDLYAWEFGRNGRALNVRIEGPLAFNDAIPAVEAAMEGLGLAYVPEDIAATPLNDGRLIRVLADWCPPAPGYHLYYASRRQMTPAFALVVESLHYREPR